MNTESFPDLPALESTETRDRQLLPLLFMFGGFALLTGGSMVYVYAKFGKYFGREGNIALAILLALIIWIILRVLTGYFHYKTGREGLTMRGPLRRCFIPWASVRMASTRKSRSSGETIVRLVTDRRTFNVSPRGLGSVTSADCIVASIWQHLRRHIHLDNFELPPRAQALWDEIRNDVPIVMEWGKPLTRCSKVLTLTGLIVFAAFIMGTWFWGGLIFGALMTALVIPLGWLALPEILCQYCRKLYFP